VVELERSPDLLEQKAAEVLPTHEVFETLGKALDHEGSIRASIRSEARLNLEALNLLVHIFEIPFLTILHVPEDHDGCTLPVGLLFYPLSDAPAHEKRDSCHGFFSFIGPFHLKILSSSNPCSHARLSSY
jgi:hypothetical protein